MILPSADFIGNGQDDMDLPVQIRIDTMVEFVKRVNIPINSSITPEQIAEMMRDPWISSGKYGLGWVYFGVTLVFCSTLFRLFNFWGDRTRTALYKEEVINSAIEAPPHYDQYPLSTSKSDELTQFCFFPEGLPSTRTCDSAKNLFPTEDVLPPEIPRQEARISSIKPLNNFIAFLRFLFYRPVPSLSIWTLKLSFPSTANVVIIVIGLIFCMLRCFLTQPLFFSKMKYGSPPLAIRAGMLSVALMPWIVALASKVNLISYLTGIGAERLIVLHRWAAYMCMALAIIHAVPFWWQSAHDPIGFAYFRQYFNQQYYIFTTGIVALVPLVFICLHSLPILRHKAYEVFVLLHIPMSWLFIGTLFWHCHNYLTSWAYLYSTIILLFISLIGRLFYLNWSNPTLPSFLIGEESAITILPENAIKVTIPTRRRWRPGQYVYIRMPGIAILDNHPFTIASLCSEDFPSDYGEEYRDMTLIFRPFGGFTRKMLDTAMKKGPYKTYRAFIEGPYGGMRRQMSSFDQVIFFAGGSGITAIGSQLLDLVKRMRDGKAITTKIYVMWAMKRPEITAFFKEELRICRQFAPPDSLHCNFYITSATRYQTFPAGVSDTQLHRLSSHIGEQINDTMQGVASKRGSKLMETFNIDTEDTYEITALPQTHLAPPKYTSDGVPYFPPPPKPSDRNSKAKSNGHDKHASTLSLVYTESSKTPDGQLRPPQPVKHRNSQSSHRHSSKLSQTFDYGIGFSKDPTPFQKSLMRFAFHPTITLQPNMAHLSTSLDQPKHNFDSTTTKDACTLPTPTPKTTPYRPGDGWTTEYGRPDIPYTLRTLSHNFGRRTCVFVCGPPSMRVDVARTVAELQRTVWESPDRAELFLHTENYSL